MPAARNTRSSLIGWDRERTERSAGLRTFPLVAIASCGFIQATAGMLQGSPEGSARIAEGLITGIGFIGGGAIVKNGTNVRGTATAASLWATGAIGATVGLGAYDVACVVSLFTILTLRLLVPLKREKPRQPAIRWDEVTPSSTAAQVLTKRRPRDICRVSGSGPLWQAGRRLRCRISHLPCADGRLAPDETQDALPQLQDPALDRGTRADRDRFLPDLPWRMARSRRARQAD